MPLYGQKTPVWKRGKAIRRGPYRGASPTTFQIRIKDPPSGHLQLFSVGDNLRAKAFTGSAVLDNWFQVVKARDPGASAGYYAYDCTLMSGTPTTFPAGTGVVDYGPSGSAFISLSADGTLGSAPNMTMGTVSGTPWAGTATDIIVRTRIGNLNGSYGYVADTYGVGFGRYGVASETSITIDTTNGIRIINNTTVLGQWYANGDFQVGDSASSKGNVFITAAGQIQVRRGATNYITLDATDAQFVNLIKMSGASAAISLGTTPPTSASAGTGIWLDRTGMFGLLSNVVQVKLDATTGAITAGAGNIVLDANGATITAQGSYASSSAIRFQVSGPSDAIRIYALTAGAGVVNSHVRAVSVSGQDTRLNIVAENGLNMARITLSGGSATNVASLELYGDSSLTKGYINAFGTAFQGVYIGGSGVLPDTFLHLAASSGLGAITWNEESTTPANPTSGTQMRVYMKTDKLVIQYNDAGTVRYKYLDLTGTGVTWVHTTTAP